MAPLGQIGKRLQIIKTAISLTDKEIITMQCSKLRLHKNDQQLNNILSVLDDENYVQATKLIDRYLHGPYDEEQSTAPKAEESPTAKPADDTVEIERKKRRNKEEEELIRKFGLFMEEASKEEYNPIDEDEMLLMAKRNRENTKPSEEELLTPAPAQPSPEEIMAEFNTIERDKLPQSDRIKSTPPRRTETVERKEKVVEAEEEKEEELSFDINEIPLTGKRSTYTGNPVEKEDIKSNIVGELPELEEPEEIEEPVQKETPEEVEESDYKEMPEPEEIPVPEEEKAAEKPKAESIEYDPISYIDQKFRNMRNQYPQVEESSERYESVERLLYMISLEGYTEADIEKTIDQVFELKGEGKLAEASHLLLIAAATESLYAQFILARELYKGEILKKDLPEAFTQINRLALNDYPEAICDLAQFYEYGIGIGKDKKKAFSLYEDALELGVQRAETHLSRMEEASRGILGKLFRR